MNPEAAKPIYFSIGEERREEWRKRMGRVIAATDLSEIEDIIREYIVDNEEVFNESDEIALMRTLICGCRDMLFLKTMEKMNPEKIAKAMHDAMHDREESMESEESAAERA